ncbi:hypothetical protein HKX48_003844 [Thoreauomyces humboldtii]|nr:hypothetical protein HKX48_003844 [Thoreauomyces humboldtii]
MSLYSIHSLVNIKGVHGYALRQTVYPAVAVGVDGLGVRLLFDRLWLIANPDGKMFTQRTHPSMALITTAIKLKGSSEEMTSVALGAYENGGDLLLNAPGMKELRVPFPQPQNSGDLSVTADIHGHEVGGLDEGATAAAWVSEVMGVPARLLVKDPNRVRSLDGDAPAYDLFEGEPQTAFADGSPMLIISQGSLDDLNNRLSARNAPPVTLRNFRPNLIFSSLPPYGEDQLLRIAVGPERRELYITSRCTRCLLPNVDPNTGEAHKKEPNATLMSYRRIDAGAKFSACLGVNAIPTEADWAVKVGNAVEVLDAGDIHHRGGIWNGGKTAKPFAAIDSRAANGPVLPAKIGANGWVARNLFNIVWAVVTIAAVIASPALTRWLAGVKQ